MPLHLEAPDVSLPLITTNLAIPHVVHGLAATNDGRKGPLIQIHETGAYFLLHEERLWAVDQKEAGTAVEQAIEERAVREQRRIRNSWNFV